MTRIDNVRIKDLLALLSRLHLDYEIVDIIVDPEERRVIIDPVEDKPIMENPNKVEIRSKDIDDII